MKKLLLLSLLAACESKSAPPIIQGKCVVDIYKGSVAMKQLCVFKGYNYACTTYDCTRTGEATGEQPKPTP